MPNPLTFQQVILRLQEFWATHGCLIWQPYSEKVGAGTMNVATALRVLGPEPWNVAYVEPSYRPPDGRYGENPNRMQYYYQYQVILKPDPGDPQELYLESLYALGLQREQHDIRFVEGNWEQPALGAWGLGWEVWLDGLEITQFTYFQQAGGFALDPVSVEITYGLERTVMFLQRVRSVWDIDWDGIHTYGEILLRPEIENCTYGFEVADVERLTRMYDLFEAEARSCLDAHLVVPAHDYVLRCSHTFNLLDARGAIGVTERATYFGRMRDLFRRVAENYVEQRQRMEYPELEDEAETVPAGHAAEGRVTTTIRGSQVPATFLLEIGTEELPAGDLDDALAQLRQLVPTCLEEARLDHEQVRVLGTPRRLIVLVEGLAPAQRPMESLVKGPPVHVAFDAEGEPTRAAIGFARKQGVEVQTLEVLTIEGGEYVVAVAREEGRPAAEVLAEILPDLVAELHFARSMRWNQSNVAFSRPIRWFVSLLGSSIVPFAYAGVQSGRVSRGSRPEGSPDLPIADAEGYLDLLARHGIIADPEERRTLIARQAEALAREAGGAIPHDPELLDEVTNLVEQPLALLGRFERAFLRLPAEVLVAVMKKHQRYFPVVADKDRPTSASLLPYFVAVRNGGQEHIDIVRTDNEEVIRARFSDADFFYREDIKQPLADFVPRLETLTFQEQLGSMLDKTHRLEQLVLALVPMVGLSREQTVTAQRAAYLCKADLATQMVVELTSLQGVVGHYYALRSGETAEVAQAILDHYLPRFAGDALSETLAGLAVGMANRLDSLMGLFAVGLTPTGSSDPYHLRRDALGLVENLIGWRISFSLRDGLVAAGRLLPVAVPDGVLGAVLDFIMERLRGLLRDGGFGFSVVDAVLAARGDDPFRARQGVEELSAWVAREDWNQILDNYARCVRITRDIEEFPALDPARFVERAEEELYQAYLGARAQVTPDSSIDEFLSAFAPLTGVIDRYFGKESGVMVMAEDLVLRGNRLSQLQHIAALADGIVDLSRLEGF